MSAIHARVVQQLPKTCLGSGSNRPRLADLRRFVANICPTYFVDVVPPLPSTPMPAQPQSADSAERTPWPLPRPPRRRRSAIWRVPLPAEGNLHAMAARRIVRALELLSGPRAVWSTLCSSRARAHAGARRLFASGPQGMCFRHRRRGNWANVVPRRSVVRRRRLWRAASRPMLTKFGNIFVCHIVVVEKVSVRPL